MSKSLNDRSVVTKLITRLSFAYRYIFVRTYRWQLKQFGPMNTPEFVGASSVAWLIWFNLITLLIFIKFLTGVDLTFVDQTLWVLISPCLLLHVLALYIYTSRNKYYEIAKEFENETEIEKRKRGFYVWGYALASVILFIASMFTLRMAPLL